MRLSELIIVSYDGQQRRLRFNENGLNIITGESATGKSAIIHIVDYCFASKNCHIPLGIIRDKVNWFCLIIVTKKTKFLICRKNPEHGRKTSSEIYVEFFNKQPECDFSNLSSNTNIDGLKNILADILGLSENLHVPEDGHSRPALEANFSHSKIFCFQDQSIIDSKNQLFFSQQDGFVAQAIRDTLPYFLGAVDADELVKQRQLAGLRKRLRQLERQKTIAEGWRVSSIERAQSLLSESRQVGLLERERRPVSEDAVQELLSELVARPISEIFDPLHTEELDELETERDALSDEFFSISNRIEEALNLSSAQDAFGKELLEQKLRLAIVPQAPSGTHVCPLCESELEDYSDSVAELNRELEEVSDSISDLQSHGPRIQKYVAELEDRRGILRNQIQQSQAQINAVIRQSDQLRDARDVRAKQARVQGRISAFLENAPQDEDLVQLVEDIASIEFKISNIEDDLSGDNFRSRLRNAESNLESLITSYVQELELEHSSGRTRLDLTHLTVVSETSERTIRLEEMGSGDNWVGCHLAVHFALHNWFRQKSRPVPSILILDQPSKAHYPPEVETAALATDEDRRAVLRLFRFILEKTNMSEPFQTIVLDHADEGEEWFQDSVVERWRDGKKLVPPDWPNQPLITPPPSAAQR